jgi:hypothetical protein
MERYDKIYGHEDIKLFHDVKVVAPYNLTLDVDTVNNLTSFETTLAKELRKKQMAAAEIYGENSNDIL